jgi:hypothetical protein
MIWGFFNAFNLVFSRPKPCIVLYYFSDLALLVT